MTFDELKAVVIEWYEADVGNAKADKYLRRIDAQQQLERAARCLIEECGESGGDGMSHTPSLHRVRDQRALADEKCVALNKAAPDMLEALEEVMGELDVEGLPCPLCGRNLTIGHRHNCLWWVVESAVRKARGEDA